MGLLHHTRIVAPDASPTRHVLFLHGLLGTGTNWRSFARRLVEALPSWAAVTVDLRMHGASLDFAPPHTLRACADDVAALVSSLPGPVPAVVGHSLGGKVALAFLEKSPPALDRLAVLDSNPGAEAVTDDAFTERVLGTLAATTFPVHSHRTFWEAMERAGLAPNIAQWLGMNLVHDDGGYRFGPDLAAVRALLDDHRRQDFWSVVERAPSTVRLAFLLGGHSLGGGPVQKRLEALSAQRPSISVEVLPEAGHWVHVDDPEGTFRFLRRFLDEPADSATIRAK